jgi:glycosyltransferase involved in cell wall biosynthesis
MRVLMIVPMSQPIRMPPVLRQISSLRARGIEVDVFEITGIRFLKYLQALPRLASRSRSFDLVHGHYGFCGWLARAQRGCPVVVSFMGDDLLGTRAADGRITRPSRLFVELNRRFARLVDAVIVKSGQMAEVIAPLPAFVIPNGVDLEAFRPIEAAEARAELGWQEGRRYILFPGDPDDPNKGFELARAAVEQATDGTAGELELVPLWRVDADRVSLLMNACSALLMTSQSEGSPNVVKEAMACNLPVVSVPVGDVPELIAGVDPSVVCARDPRELAEAIVTVSTGGGRSNGREALRRKGLDLESVAREIESIYRQVLNGGL